MFLTSFFRELYIVVSVSLSIFFFPPSQTYSHCTSIYTDVHKNATSCTCATCICTSLIPCNQERKDHLIQQWCKFVTKPLTGFSKESVEHRKNWALWHCKMKKTRFSFDFTFLKIGLLLLPNLGISLLKVLRFIFCLLIKIILRIKKIWIISQQVCLKLFFFLQDTFN